MVLCGISESAQNAQIPALCVFDKFRILFPYGESHKNPEIEIEGKSSILKNWFAKYKKIVGNLKSVAKTMDLRFLSMSGGRWISVEILENPLRGPEVLDFGKVPKM